MEKRGLNAIVAMTILISLVISTIGIFFVWNKQIFSLINGEEDQQKKCSELEFRVADFCKEEVEITNVETGESIFRTHLIFNAQSLLEEQRIEGFSFFITDNFGNTQVISTLPYNNLYSINVKNLVTNFISQEEDIDELKIIPQILLDKKIILCDDKFVKTEWEQIETC